MPEVKNCRKCKKIFMWTNGPQICQACLKLEEEEFDKVRVFLRDFPGATINEVSAATEVDTQLIYRFLKEGRLEVTSSSPIALQCETCGVRISSGRFCVGCSKKLATEMMSTGRKLMETVEKQDNKKADDGLRYMHEYKRDK